MQTNQQGTRGQRGGRCTAEGLVRDLRDRRQGLWHQRIQYGIWTRLDSTWALRATRRWSLPPGILRKGTHAWDSRLGHHGGVRQRHWPPPGPSGHLQRQLDTAKLDTGRAGGARGYAAVDPALQCQGLHRRRPGIAVGQLRIRPCHAATPCSAEAADRRRPWLPHGSDFPEIL